MYPQEAIMATQGEFESYLEFRRNENGAAPNCHAANAVRIRTPTPRSITKKTGFVANAPKRTETANKGVSMPQYKLTRVMTTDKSGDLRGEGVEGEAVEPPRVGERFVMTAGVRFVSTSPVVDVDVENGTFSTLSGSIYRLEKIAEN